MSAQPSPPPRRSVRLSIAVPASTLSVEPSLREKTLKAGLIGRAAAIFRVEEIIVYLDSERYRKDFRVFVEVLRYLETPPHLRKRLVPLKPILRYAGLLPPLQTPHHPSTSKPRAGEYREGVVLGYSGDKLVVDVGLGKPLVAEGPRVPRMSRIAVRITSLSPLEGVVEEPPYYWGFSVVKAEGLLGAIEAAGADLVIATSRWGVPLERVRWELEKRLGEAGKVLVLFGGPHEGLYLIARRERFDLEERASMVVNFVPEQGTRTVRTEEAVFIVLGILNVLGRS